MALVLGAYVTMGREALDESTLVPRLGEAFEAKARAELAAADALAPGSDVVAWSGTLLPHVALVKGAPGPAEASGGAALSGPDGEAAAKALVALGWPEDSWFATLSRPDLDLEPERLVARLKLVLEAVDPIVIVALDPVAAGDVASALGCDGLAPAGAPVIVAGRRVIAVEGFEASLADESRKRVIWAQLKQAAPPGPVY